METSIEIRVRREWIKRKRALDALVPVPLLALLLGAFYNAYGWITTLILSLIIGVVCLSTLSMVLDWSRTASQVSLSDSILTVRNLLGKQYSLPLQEIRNITLTAVSNPLLGRDLELEIIGRPKCRFRIRGRWLAPPGGEKDLNLILTAWHHSSRERRGEPNRETL